VCRATALAPVLGMALLLEACSPAPPEPTRPPAPTATVAPSATPVPTQTVAPTPTMSLTQTVVPSATSMPSETAAPMNTPVPPRTARPTVPTDGGAPSPRGTGSAPPEGIDCPAGYPIKGDRATGSEWLYRAPGAESYETTRPEECFATEADAQAAGYRTRGP
jgi:hypothetical protein